MAGNPREEGNANNCPRHCVEDRRMLREAIEDLKKARKERWDQFSSSSKWFFGICVVVLSTILGIMYRGQVQNSEKIVEAHKRLTQEMYIVSKDIGELKLIVTRIDERTKKRKLSENHDDEGG